MKMEKARRPALKQINRATRSHHTRKMEMKIMYYSLYNNSTIDVVQCSFRQKKYRKSIPGILIGLVAIEVVQDRSLNIRFSVLSALIASDQVTSN